MTESEEQAYCEGTRKVWAQLFAQACRELGYDDPLVRGALWINQREAAVSALRDLCRDYGDNDWPDNLDLSDIIDKHLHDHLALRDWDER